MNVRRQGAAICVMLLVLGTAARAEDERPYLGVRLDSEPLSELLTKHLGLDEGQGIRIRNVNLGSPADQAGLERDDIIIGFQGEDVGDVERFVQSVRQARVGAVVSVEIIHLGQRKGLEVELEPLPDDVEWKYPPEPEIVTTWHPGKFFRIGPQGQEWVEIPFDKMPEFRFDVKSFLKEVYIYHHVADGETFTITIEGNPDDDETKVIVRKGESEHSTTVDDIDALPEEYQAAARDALDSARQSARHTLRLKGFNLPKPPRLDITGRYFQDLAVPRPDLDRWSERKERILERLQEQMERLQQRMEELENRNRQMLDRLLERDDESGQEDEKPQDREAPETDSNQAV